MNQNPFYTTSQTMTKSLNSLKNIIAKVPEFAASKNITESEALDMRLAPDMFSLIKQVQVASDNAKLFAATMAGVDAPNNQDNETTVEELLARIQSSIDFMNSIDEANYNDAHTRTKTFPWMPGMYLEATDYLTQFSVPNFYFHISMAYAILRANGMVLTKQDFIGGTNLKPI